MRLVALVDGPDHVCCRYRVQAFRPRLEAMGHTVEVATLPRSWWGRLLLFRRLRGASVLLQRQLLPCWQFWLLRLAAKHLLFDIDDAVWLRDSYSLKGLHHPRKSRRFAYTVRNCDAVIAGNSYLARHALREGARRADVIPTCVEPSLYVPTTESDGKTLVWIGSSSTLQGLERIAGLLDGLARAVPGVQLKVICDRFPTFHDLSVVPVPWSEAAETHELPRADVGISWIPPDEWSRGKCGLKLLQFMAAGLPVITNPVGVHPEMVRHGETGFLATTPEDWQNAVARLLADTPLRQRMGLAGRRRMEACYSVEAGARLWSEVLTSLDGKEVRAA